MTSPSPAHEIARVLLERALEEVRQEDAACVEEGSDDDNEGSEDGEGN